MPKFFILIIVFFFASILILAQDEPDFPFITQSFFSDGVEILEIYPIADVENRMLHIYDNEQWLHLPYPDEIEILDGTYLSDSYYTPYSVSYGNGWLVSSGYDKAWRVYRDGRFYEHTFRCNPSWREINNYMRSNGQIAWIYTYLGDTEFLCNMTTNEISPELPEEDSWGPVNFDFQVPIEESTDGRYLVLLADVYGSMNSIYRYHAYSYDTQTQIFRFLGGFGQSSEELVGVGVWLSDTVITFSTDGMPEWSVVRYYTADVTQTDSLDQLSSSLRFGIPYNQQSQNFERVPSDFDDGPNIGPCYIQIYNETESVRYYTGNLCDTGLVIPSDDNEKLYRSVTPYASIVRLNLTTKERRTVFIGEVEEIVAVSPQGEYALIRLGQNGVVDILSDPFMERPYRFIDFFDTFTTYILRLSDGNLIASVPSDSKWLSDTYLYTQNQIIYLSEVGAESLELDGVVIDKLLNGEQLAIHTNQDEFVLYTASDGAITPIIPNLHGYDVEFYEREQGVLSLSLNNPEQGSPNFVLKIRLPD